MLMLKKIIKLIVVLTFPVNSLFAADIPIIVIAPGKLGYFLWKFGIINMWKRFLLRNYHIPKNQLRGYKQKPINKQSV